MDGFGEVPVVGPLFLLDAIGAAVLAVVLLAVVLLVVVLLVVVLLVVPIRLRSAAAAVTAVFTAATLAGLMRYSVRGPAVDRSGQPDLVRVRPAGRPADGVTAASMS